MNKYIIVLFTLTLAVDSFAQTRIDCNTEDLYENLQGVWRQIEGSALVIVDSNAYFFYDAEQGNVQDEHGELFGIIKNGNGETFFIWWFDLIVQEFVLEKDTLLLLDRRGCSETYIRVK